MTRLFRSTPLLATGALILGLAACGDSADPTTTVGASAPQTPPSATSPAPPPTSPTAPTSSPATTTLPPATTTTAPTTTTTVPDDVVRIDISVVGDEVIGGGRIEVVQDADVVLTVTADVTDEVHVHGYDLFAVVTPEVPAVVEFVADIPGIFEVEMEDAGTELAELEIGPS